MKPSLGLWLLLLCLVAHASATFLTSCKITASAYTPTSEPPRVKILLTFNDTLATSPTPDAPAPLFSLIKLFNVSNDAPLHPDYENDDYTISGATMSWFIVEEPGQIGEVQVRYTRQPHQPYDLTVGGDVVEEIEVDCVNDLLVTLHRGQIVDPPGGGSREIHIFFTGPVKRCDENGVDLFNSSWFVLSSTTPSISAIGDMCNTTLSHGFVPYQNSQSHWYCVANSSFNASTLQTASYTLAEGYICSVADDSNVTSHGYGASTAVQIIGQAGTATNTLRGTIYPNGTIFMFSILPPSSFANFTTARPCVWIYSPRTHTARTCCNPSNATWVRSDAVQYQCEKPYLDYQMGEEVDFLLLGDEYYHFDLPGYPQGPYAPKDPGFDTEGTSNFRMVDDERVKGIYRVDDYTIRVAFYQSVGFGVEVGNLVVYDSTKNYNATNVTRYDAYSADYGYDEDNELPALGSTFKGYFLQFAATDGTYATVPYPDTTPMVITAVPSDTPASTSTKDADLSDLSTGWKVFVWVFVGLAALFGLLLLGIFFYHCRNGGLSATGYPHQL